MKVKNLNSEIEQIVRGYKQQYQYYQDLLQLSRQLEALISADDVEDVQQLLLKRNEIIERIKVVEDNLSIHREAVMALLHLKEFNLEKVQDLIHADLRKELTEQREAIEQLIKAIIRLDSKNEEALKNHLQDVAGELKNIHQYYEIRKAYIDRPEKFPEPRFIDKKK